MSRRSDRKWRLDEFCPDNCPGLIPSTESRRICTGNRNRAAAAKAGFIREDPNVQDVFLAAGGRLAMIGQWSFIPRWVFSIVASHFPTEPIPGLGWGIGLGPHMVNDPDTVEDVKACLHDQEHRLARLTLLGHDANETIRQMALDVLEEGYEDPVMPKIPKLRKHWCCLRRAHEGAPNGADWLKVTRRIK